MNITISENYLKNLDLIKKQLGSPVFVNLTKDFETEPHFPGSKPVTLKRAVSNCLLDTVEFTYALCNTGGLTSNPYVTVMTPLGRDLRKTGTSEMSWEELYHYTSDGSFYIINQNSQCFIAVFSVDDANTPVVVIEPVQLIPHRSLVIRFLQPKAYKEWIDRQNSRTWSNPNQLINQILHGLMYREFPSELNLKDDIETSPGVKLQWEFDNIELALYYLSADKRIKAESVTRGDYVKAFEEAHASVVKHLSELGNISTNKKIVDYARTLILRDIGKLRDRYGE